MSSNSGKIGMYIFPAIGPKHPANVAIATIKNFRFKGRTQYSSFVVEAVTAVEEESERVIVKVKVKVVDTTGFLLWLCVCCSRYKSIQIDKIQYMSIEINILNIFNTDCICNKLNINGTPDIDLDKLSRFY